MRSQKEITLKNDLGSKDRLDIYRNFLLYCMSGDVVALPMGSTGAAPIKSPLLYPMLMQCSMSGQSFYRSSLSILLETLHPQVHPWAVQGESERQLPRGPPAQSQSALHFPGGPGAGGESLATDLAVLSALCSA